MSDPLQAAPGNTPLKWWQGLDRYCWVVLIIAAMGWMFDTMDQNLMNLVRVPSLKQLLHPHPDQPQLTDTEKKTLDAEVKKRSGWINSIFLIGWAAGGFVFGILGDRLGRTKTMIFTILIYAIFTGASGLVHNFWSYALMRFITALGVGGEWAAGASLVAEVFPARSRPMALGLLQGLSAVGNMMASIITLVIAAVTPESHQAGSWRWAYFVGAVPALLILWIRSAVKEPEKWKQAKEHASLGKEMGNMSDLFRHPTLRRRTLAAILMGTAGVCALWGVGFYSTDFVREELKAGGLAQKAIDMRVSIMFLLQNAGAFFGIYLFAAFSERFTRREAFFLWFPLAWATVMLFFWSIVGSHARAFTIACVMAPVMGFGTLGPFSGYTVYFPELFPTRLRATGCGLAYNAARILAAGGPFALGTLSAHFAVYAADGSVLRSGYGGAASVVTCIYVLGVVGTLIAPETRGLPLPEDNDFDTPAAERSSARPLATSATAD
jgi:MFS family permease